MTATAPAPIHGHETEETYAADERLTQLTDRVRSIRAAKLDAIANTKAIAATLIAPENAPKEIVIVAPNGMKMRLGDVVHHQWANRLKIDWRYYEPMLQHAPELLANNMNWWFTHEPEDRLLRMLKPDAFAPEQRDEMGRLGTQVFLRGVLGKGYRTIDDAELIDAILPTLIERGAQLADFSIDERRMHAKFMLPGRTGDEVRQAYAEKYGLTVEQVRHHHHVDGKDVSWVEEKLSTGVVIRHSEVGFASLGASFVTRVMKCLNDYVAEQSVAIRHVGKRHDLEDDDVRYISDATQLMENAALIGKVQDSITAELDEKHTFERVARFFAAQGTEIERPAELPLFEFVGNIGGNLGLTDEQTDLLKQETHAAILEEGGESQFAYVQGITAVARQMTDYDRRVELERSGFELLNDDAGALLKLGQDATKRRN